MHGYWYWIRIRIPDPLQGSGSAFLKKNQQLGLMVNVILVIEFQNLLRNPDQHF